LAATPRLPFAELFPEDGTRGQFVGLFLALLELIRHGQAAVDQGDPFGEICILAPAPAVADGEHPSA
ncbi:MAG TPA: hypothetical protein PKC18_17040, partial [Lacipirellulaceae bacterium]|nr:hypothetical protein [Lacipirellulaceae bacterium]